ncbi:MAG: hypothetical protein WAK55_11115 [Xanthobacteraceae bacterium]
MTVETKLQKPNKFDPQALTKMPHGSLFSEIARSAHRSHMRMVEEELLPQAKIYVSEAKRRLAAQEARVADLERKGFDAPLSKKLLKTMRETVALQIDHVRLLESEVRAEDLARD